MKKIFYLILFFLLIFNSCQSALDEAVDESGKYVPIDNNNNYNDNSNTNNNNINDNSNSNNNSSTYVYNSYSIKISDINLRTNTSIFSETQNSQHVSTIKNQLPEIVNQVLSKTGYSETHYQDIEFSIEDLKYGSGGGILGGYLGLTDLSYEFLGTQLQNINTVIYLDTKDIIDNYEHIYGNTSAKNVLIHELTHTVFIIANVRQKGNSTYFSEYPTWLHEGMAVYVEGSFNAYLEEAKYSNNFQVKGLENLSNDDYNSYFEGAATMEYLKDTYGESKLKTFFSHLVLNDTPFANALISVYSLNFSSLASRVKTYCYNKISSYKRSSIKGSTSIKKYKRIL